MVHKVDYNKVKDYLESLVQVYAKIDHFIGFNEQELHSELAKKSGLPGIILVPFKYEGSLNGNNQRTLAGRIIHFAILRYSKVNDYIAESINIAECENIGFGLLSRIYYDSKKESSLWLYKNFDQNTVEFNEIRLKGSSGLVGMEFSFELKTQQPLSIELEDWTDLDVLG